MDRAAPGSGAKKAETNKKSLRWKTLARRGGILLLAAVVLLIVVFFLLPVWISNEQGRAYILQRLNRRLNDRATSAAAGAHGPIKISVDDWSLGWFRGTDLKNLRIEGADGTALLTCPQVSSGMTLWDMVWSNYDLHTTTADGLQAAVAKYADGTSSWDGLSTGAQELLRSVRGGLQINGGEVSITSVRAGQNLHYRDLKATVTIAAPESPFHLQISATGEASGIGTGAPGSGGEDGRAAPDARANGTLSLNATLPPIRELAGGGGGGEGVRAGAVGIWDLLGDIECSATRIPTELLGDCLGLEKGWSESMGARLEEVMFSNHAGGGAGAGSADLSHPVLLIRGGGGGGTGFPTAIAPGDATETQLSARLFLRMSQNKDGLITGGMLSAGSGSATGAGDFLAQATLRMSPNLAGWLRRVNPLLGEARADPAGASRGESRDGLVHIVLTSISVPLGEPRTQARAAVRITFPGLQFVESSPPQSLLHQLRGMTSLPRQGPIAGTAGSLRFTLADDTISYENFVVAMRTPGGGETRVNFSGSVGLDGRLQLVAMIDGAGRDTAVFSSGSTQVGIAGTVDAPVIQRAE